MAFKSGSKEVMASPTLPAMYGSGDTATPPSNENVITASDGASYAFFGHAVAVGAGKIVVGAYNSGGSYSGSAYLYDYSGTQLTKITPADSGSYDQFGKSVAVGSGRIVVGASGDSIGFETNRAGGAYLFDLDGNQLFKITPTGGAATDAFGWSVSIGSDRICVGAYNNDGNGFNSGTAYIFDLDGNQLANLLPFDGTAFDYFGFSVAVGSGRVVVGAIGDDDKGSDAGSAYIFDLDGNQLAKITASDGAAGDQFGNSVAVGSGRIVVGAHHDADNGYYTGSAYIFDLDGNQLKKITASDGESYDWFGSSVAVGSGRICVGAYNKDNGAYSNAGDVYIYDLDGNEVTKLTASDTNDNDQFGDAVAVGDDKIIVGANGYNNETGKAYIYDTPKIITPYDVEDWERG